MYTPAYLCSTLGWLVFAIGLCAAISVGLIWLLFKNAMQNARAAGVDLQWIDIANMILMRLPVTEIIDAAIEARHARLGIPIAGFIVQARRGVRVDRAVNACIIARRHGHALSFEQACGMDVAGRDAAEYAMMGIDPFTGEPLDPLQPATCRRNEHGQHRIHPKQTRQD